VRSVSDTSGSDQRDRHDLAPQAQCKQGRQQQAGRCRERIGQPHHDGVQVRHGAVDQAMPD